MLHYGQQMEHCTLERLWNELKASCDFLAARKKVEQFNIHNRWKKHGMAIIPTKFGISFTAKFMNQVVFVLILMDNAFVSLAYVNLMVNLICPSAFWF